MQLVRHFLQWILLLWGINILKANIIDGKQLAALLNKEYAVRVQNLVERGIMPKLSVILVGNNPASEVYVRSKLRAAKRLGMDAEVIRRDENATQGEVIALVETLNADVSVHGILVQLPLPDGIDKYDVLLAIDPKKDVDGLHPLNAGILMTGGTGIVPGTPKGILRLIESTGIEIAGKHVVVIGRSNIVGRPLSMLMQRQDATVTMCHSHTRNLAMHTRMADILICAAGHAGLITKDMVKDGAIVIDVGMTRINDKWQGDVCFDEVSEVASFITPMPGGVGPMTVAMLMENTIEAAECSMVE